VVNGASATGYGAVLENPSVGIFLFDYSIKQGDVKKIARRQSVLIQSCEVPAFGRGFIIAIPFQETPKKRKGTGCLLVILRRVYIQVGVSGGMPNRRLGTLFTVVVVEHSSGSRVFMATARNQSPGYWHINSFTSTG
jgi:hypothetical protein